MPNTSKHEVVSEGLRIARSDPSTGSLLRAMDYVWEQALIIGSYLHELEDLSQRLTSQFDKIGWKLAAEQLGISEDELRSRLIPTNLVDCTMSELRMLANTAEVTIEYEVKRT